jgi:hypothetical protein
MATITTTAASSALSSEAITAAIRQEHEAASTPAQSAEDSRRRIHGEYKAECEALGYDVDGNRKAVWAALDSKRKARATA